MVDIAGEAAEHVDSLKADFGSLPRSLYTLFMSMSGGVSWGDPVANLAKAGGHYLAMFIVYEAFTLFAVLNIITGFFVDNAMESQKNDKDQAITNQLKNRAKYIKEFQSIFDEIDEDKSGDITFDELHDNMHNARLRVYLAHLNIDIDKAWDIFRLLDTGNDGSVSMEEFVVGCLKLRGPAKTTDIHLVRRELSDLRNIVSQSLKKLQSSVDHRGERMSVMDSRAEILAV